MTLFRPCIDLHEGRVKQVVGGSFADGDQPLTNFVAEQPARYFAELYRRDGLTGGHVIMLGPGNEAVALEALAAYPGGLQVGGGITTDNAAHYLDAGASHVIVTSHVFHDGRVDMERLRALTRAVGRERLVLDLSCRRRGNDYVVFTDRWRTPTDVRVAAETLATLAEYCAEFLIHAVDVEGRQQGVDWELVDRLAAYSPLPTTYAGGASSLDDLTTLEARSGGRLDLTIGSALDIFGGRLIRYADCVAFNRRAAAQRSSPPSATV